jgi:hypothetical protein
MWAWGLTVWEFRMIAAPYDEAVAQTGRERGSKCDGYRAARCPINHIMAALRKVVANIE